MCRRHHAKLRLTDTIEPMLEAGTRRRDGRVWDRCVAMRERRTENEARRYETGNCGTKEEMVWRKREPCRHAQKTEPLRPCGLAGKRRRTGRVREPRVPDARSQIHLAGDGFARWALVPGACVCVSACLWVCDLWPSLGAGVVLCAAAAAQRRAAHGSASL